MKLDKKLLIEKGYLTFNLKDLDENLFNEFKKVLTKKYLRSKIDILRADFVVTKENIDEFLEIPDKYEVKIDERIVSAGHPKGSIKAMNKYYATIPILKEIQKDISKVDTSSTKYNHDGQAWMYGMYPRTSMEKINLIESLYVQTVVELYKEDIINHKEFKTKPNINNQDPFIGAGTDISLYVKDNYISNHADGIDGNRLCVVLMYLNDDWESGYGGEIIVKEEITIPPLFGNVVILDFTENNVEHEVKKVINENFERFAIIKFFYK
jgi:translation initiation factor IF-3